jgi:hypothetical protein
MRKLWPENGLRLADEECLRQKSKKTDLIGYVVVPWASVEEKRGRWDGVL